MIDNDEIYKTFMDYSMLNAINAIILFCEMQM